MSKSTGTVHKRIVLLFQYFETKQKEKKGAGEILQATYIPSIRSLHGFGHVLGIGKVSLLMATPYTTARASIPL